MPDVKPATTQNPDQRSWTCYISAKTAGPHPWRQRYYPDAASDDFANRNFNKGLVERSTPLITNPWDNHLTPMHKYYHDFATS